MKKKTWLVTGTSSGFGKELAICLIQKDNINLVATARDLQDLSYLDQYDKGQLLKVKLDVTKHNEVIDAVSSTLDRFGTLDVLVNNAGLGYFGTFEESDIAKVRYMFDVNVWGLADMTRAVLPAMRNQKSGTIICFSSIGGLVSFPCFSFYHGTKYAIEGLMESLAQEVESSNIKIMSVEPSGFRTDWAGRSSDKAIPVIDYYKQFSELIDDVKNKAGQELGDPKIAAEIIYDQVENHYVDLPSNLPLGEMAITQSLKKFKRLTNLFEKLSDIGKSADKPV